MSLTVLHVAGKKIHFSHYPHSAGLGVKPVTALCGVFRKNWLNFRGNIRFGRLVADYHAGERASFGFPILLPIIRLEPPRTMRHSNRWRFSNGSSRDEVIDFQPDFAIRLRARQVGMMREIAAIPRGSTSIALASMKARHSVMRGFRLANVLQ